MQVRHYEIEAGELRTKIRQKEIRYGGNLKLKIYGRLQCKSGRRMKRINRVFFGAEADANKSGFRPCGHCMNAQYKNWKNGPF